MYRVPVCVVCVWVACVGGVCAFVWGCNMWWVCSGVCRGHVGWGWGLRVCVGGGGCVQGSCVGVWRLGGGGLCDVHVSGVGIGVVGVRSFVCAAYVWWGV